MQSLLFQLISFPRSLIHEKKKIPSHAKWLLLEMLINKDRKISSINEIEHCEALLISRKFSLFLGAYTVP